MTADLLTSQPQATAPIQVRLPVGGQAPWGYPSVQ